MATSEFFIRFRRLTIVLGGSAVVAVALLMSASVGVEAIRAGVRESWWFAPPVLIGFLLAIATVYQRRRLTRLIAPLSNQRKALVIVFLFPYLFQLALVFTVRTTPVSDFAVYWETGQTLWQTGEFIHTDPRGLVYRVHKTPGMALYLAGAYGLFGDSTTAVQLVNVHLLLAGNVIFYILMRGYFTPGIALGATALFAFWPSRSFSAALLGYDAPATLALLSFWFLAETKWRRHTIAMFAAGLSLGIAAMLRTPLLTLVVIFPLYRCLTASCLRTALRDGLVLACGVAVLFGPWAYRNHLVVGEPMITSIQSGLSFYRGMHPEAGRYYTNVGFDRLVEESGGDERLMNKLGWRYGWEFLASDPLGCAWRALRKLYRLFESDHETAGLVFDTPGGPLSDSFYHRARAVACGLCDVWYAWLALTTLIMSRNIFPTLRATPALLWPIMALLTMIAVHAIFEAQPRYFVVYQCLWAPLVAVTWSRLSAPAVHYEPRL